MEAIDPVNIISAATGGRFRKGGGYLSCDNCLGYYELQRWESPEDFCEQCECGGYLTFTPLIERYVYSDNQVNHFVDDPNLEQNRNGLEQKWEQVDSIKMDEENQEILNENYGKEVEIPRELPWGPILIFIFFIVSIVTFGIFSMFVSVDPVILVMNF